MPRSDSKRAVKKAISLPPDLARFARYERVFEPRDAAAASQAYARWREAVYAGEPGSL